MGTLLPEALTVEQFRAVARDEARLGAGVKALCERHRLAGVAISRFADGSLPVYALGESWVLKLYPPVFRHELDVEAPLLEALHGQLPIPTPRLEATGECDGWHYVLMERHREPARLHPAAALILSGEFFAAQEAIVRHL